MTDIPVIMSAPMVLATKREVQVPGTGKTETRRFAWGPRFEKAIDDEGGRPGWCWGVWQRGQCAWPSGKTLVHMGLPPDAEMLIGHMAPSNWQKVKPGDRLWVRENLCAMSNWGLWHDAGPPPRQECFLDDLDERGRAVLERYAPTEATDSALVPSIHMPRWASRLTLIVTATKLERLQDIGEVRALAEGVMKHPTGGFYVHGVEHPNKDFPFLSRPSPREMFAALWDVIHGAGAWDANPEVVAVTFRPFLTNIDAMPRSEAA